MRTFLALLLLPATAFGADLGKIDVSSNISHSDGISLGLSDSGQFKLGLAGDGYTFTFDESDNDMEVGAYGVYLSHSDSKNIGVGYGAGIGLFDGGVHYHWMSSGNHIVGGSSLISYQGVGLTTGVEWNGSEFAIDGTLGTSLDLWGAKGSLTSNWDIDSFSYEGLDFSAGYAIPVADGLEVTPTASMGLDGDWERSDIKVSLSINMSFGGSNGNL